HPVLRRSGLGVLVAQLLRRVPGRARDRQERRHLLRPLAEGDAAADPHRDARPPGRHLLGGTDRAYRSEWSGRPEPGAHGAGRLRPAADPRRPRALRPPPTEPTPSPPGSPRSRRRTIASPGHPRPIHRAIRHAVPPPPPPRTG